MISELNTAAILVDVQEKLFAKIAHKEALLKKLVLLIQAFQILKIPILVSEQYPKGLGLTIGELRSHLGAQYSPFEKTAFSVMKEGSLQQHIKKMAKENWILFGIETHVCVLQTALDLKASGYQAITIADAVSSRDLENKQIALEQLRSEKVVVTSSESVLFELLKDAKHPHFKEISALLKDHI